MTEQVTRTNRERTIAALLDMEREFVTFVESFQQVIDTCRELRATKAMYGRIHDEHLAFIKQREQAGRTNAGDEYEQVIYVKRPNLITLERHLDEQIKYHLTNFALPVVADYHARRQASPPPPPPPKSPKSPRPGRVHPADPDDQTGLVSDVAHVIPPTQLDTPPQTPQ
jgi:hypothetical protein